MKTVTINSQEYSVGKLDAFEQIHVGRKLAPLLAHAIPAFMQIAPESAEKPGIEDIIISAAAIPMADVLASMSQEDVDYVLHKCLSKCQRRQAKGWANVFVAGNLMFADMEGDTLIQLTKEVVEVSLGRFFPTSQSASTPVQE